MSRFSPWKSVTSARIGRPHDLRRAVRRANAYLVGVVGFSGSWHHNARPNAASVARATLNTLFDSLCDKPTVWCVSGATDLGVPSLAYAVAGDRGLIRVGVTAEAARSHPLAPLDWLVPIGRQFGDESETFVSLCDVLWMIGGGPQSKSEVLLAARQNKPVVIVRGLGGAAETLSAADVPTAKFLEV